MKPVIIRFVNSNECDDCKKMQLAIENVMGSIPIPCNLDFIYFEKPAAIKLAIQCNVKEIPFCVIGESDDRVVFVGKNFTEEAMAQAIENIWTSQ